MQIYGLDKKRLTLKKQRDLDMSATYYILIDEYIKTQFRTDEHEMQHLSKAMKFDFEIKYVTRCDVLFKTIMREIRKVYLKIFTVETHFLKTLKHQTPLFYLSSLVKFVKKMTSTEELNLGNLSTQTNGSEDH